MIQGQDIVVFQGRGDERLALGQSISHPDNGIENLAPGDFRTVRQGRFYLDVAPSNLDRIAALKDESALKGENKAMSHIGFRVRETLES